MASRRGEVDSLVFTSYSTVPLGSQAAESLGSGLCKEGPRRSKADPEQERWDLGRRHAPHRSKFPSAPLQLNRKEAPRHSNAYAEETMLKLLRPV